MAKPRSTDSGVVQIILQSQKLNEAARLARRESTAVLTLGALSGSLAIGALIATAMELSTGGHRALSFYCDRLASSGMILGGWGLVLSLLRRKLSWLSAIGFVLSLATLVTVAAIGALMRLER